MLGGLVTACPIAQFRAYRRRPSHSPRFGDADNEFHGNTNIFYSSPTNGFGGNQLLTYGTKRYGLLLNANARRINRLRPGAGLDTHAAVTRMTASVGAWMVGSARSSNRTSPGA